MVSGTFNIHTQNSTSGRSCPDGGDAVIYQVTGLAESSVTLSSSVSEGCLSVGDEVMLINVQGTSSNYANVGNYEFFRVAAATDNTVVFTTEKTKSYGDNGGDTNIGTGGTNQHVLLMRVPNYHSVTVNGTLTGSAWNGAKYGLMVFRVQGTLQGPGTISMNALGYRGGNNGHSGCCGQPQYARNGGRGEGIAGGWDAQTVNNLVGGGGGGQGNDGQDGGGGSYGTLGGATSGTGNGKAGIVHGEQNLSKFVLGSGGGGADDCGYEHGTDGGRGGGGIYISARVISFLGSISTTGANGIQGTGGSMPTSCVAAIAGGGSGGSILLWGETISAASLRAVGGAGNGKAGGKGRIALFYETSVSYGSSDPSAYVEQFGSGPTSTPTSTFTPTPTPATQPDWSDSVYFYESSQPHAVTSVYDGVTLNEYAYDANGNMTSRTELGITWRQEFNAENRLASITDGTDTWTFVYDGDGNRVKQTNPDGKVTIFLGGGLYTVEDAAGISPQVIKYYTIAGQRVAMDDGSLMYLLTDHLGSVVAVADGSGNLVSEQRYMPFGAVRDEGGISETDFGYTGQRNLADVGLMDYNARWYDENLGRFISADSVVPGAGNPQAFNRLTYVFNNPIRFNDLSGNSAGDFNGSTWVLEDPTNPRLCTGLACWGGTVSISTTPGGGGGGSGGGGYPSTTPTTPSQFPTSTPSPQVSTPQPDVLDLRMNPSGLVQCNLNPSYWCVHPNDRTGYHYVQTPDISSEMVISLGLKALIAISVVLVQPELVVIFAAVDIFYTGERATDDLEVGIEYYAINSSGLGIAGKLVVNTVVTTAKLFGFSSKFEFVGPVPMPFGAPAPMPVSTP